jgi:tetratricopeptide (TPR) repeat protein
LFPGCFDVKRFREKISNFDVERYKNAGVCRWFAGNPAGLAAGRMVSGPESITYIQDGYMKKNCLVKRAGRMACGFLALALFILSGCSSGPPIIPTDLSVLQFFQRAQEEAESEDWEDALYYYQTYIDRYPDDLPNIMMARYEIAFINYKQEKYQEAIAGFEEILDFYENTTLPLDFPLWPRVLSRKMIESIEKKIGVPAAEDGNEG